MGLTIGKVVKFFKDKEYRFDKLNNFGWYKRMDDEPFLKKYFFVNL